MSTARISRNDPCYCGSGKKFKHCCHTRSFANGMPQPRPVPTDGASLRLAPEPPRTPPLHRNPVTRVPVEYEISETTGKAEVAFCYDLGTLVILSNGDVIPIEHLEPGMQFRLEDGGLATTKKVEKPEVHEPPSQDRDANGNSYRRVIDTVKYTGYYPRMDFGVPGEVIKTTPGHRFYSLTRGGWYPIDTFRRGEFLRNERGMPVPVEWIDPMRWEFGELFNAEIEEYHTYFVGNGPSSSIWSHNGMGNGCSVPKAANPGPSGVLSTAKYLLSRWDKATFTTVWKSIQYHLAKHGGGLTAVQYTQQAMKAFADSAATVTKVTDKLGRPAVRVVSEFGQGLFTRQGRVIWFQP
jgi:hypothetical protein